MPFKRPIKLYDILNQNLLKSAASKSGSCPDEEPYEVLTMNFLESPEPIGVSDLTHASFTPIATNTFQTTFTNTNSWTYNTFPTYINGQTNSGSTQTSSTSSGSSSGSGGNGGLFGSIWGFIKSVGSGNVNLFGGGGVCGCPDYIGSKNAATKSGAVPDPVLSCCEDPSNDSVQNEQLFYFPLPDNLFESDNLIAEDFDCECVLNDLDLNTAEEFQKNAYFDCACANDNAVNMSSFLGLAPEQTAWLARPENKATRDAICKFAKDHGHSEEAVEFVDSAFRDLMLNKKVDLEESFASPFNVDLELVRPSILNPEPEKVKFMCIYNKLTKSPTFKKLFIDTFGESENLHVKFKIVENIPPVHPSTTEPNGIAKTSISMNPTTGEVTGFDSVIEINKSNMNVSSLAIAKTIFHEAIHAYLSVKQYKCGGTSFNEINDKELSELLNLYFSTACPSQSDHEFMFDFLLPTMSEILKQIRDDFVPLSHQQSAEYETFINESNPAGPEIPWNWNDFYKYFSMSGLQNSDAFQFEMLPTTSPKYQNFNHYANTGVFGFSKECNE